MTIASVEALPLEYQLPDGEAYGSARGLSSSRTATLVKVTADDGTVGWGEASGPPRVLAAIVDSILAEWVVGEDLDSIGSLSERAYTSLYHFSSGGLLQAAISGLDIALWDLRGKRVGQPVYSLLGGARRDAVSPYASTMYYTAADRDPAEPVERAVEAGFEAVKIKLGRDPAEDLDRVRIAREVMDDGTVLVDCNGNYRADQAVRLAESIEPYDVGWLEEPVAPENVEGYREVRASTSIPIAGGEAALTRFQFDPLFDERAIDIAQPDVCMCGGLTEARIVADMAATHNVGVSPHCWMGGIGLAATLHLAVTLPRYPHADHEPAPPLLEVDRAHNPLRTELLADPLDLTQPSIEPPAGPGLGIEVDIDAVERYLVER